MHELGFGTLFCCVLLKFALFLVFFAAEEIAGCFTLIALCLSLFCVASTRCHRFVCDLSLWYAPAFL